MWTRARRWGLVVLVGSACARENPDFQGMVAQSGSIDTDSGTSSASSSASSTASTSPLGGTTAQTTSAADSTGDDAGATTEEQAETGSQVGDTIVYVTQPVPGAFAAGLPDAWTTAIGLCQGTLTTHFPGLACSQTWPLLPIDGISIHDIPTRPGGAPLGQGAVFAPNGVDVAASFESVASAMVLPTFVDAVTEHLNPDTTDLTMWWGQTSGGQLGGNCDEWSTTQLMGTTLTLDAAATPGPPLSGANFCGQPHHLLCACF